MSDRTGDYRDPFKDSQNRRLRKNYLGGINDVARIDALNAEIAAKGRAERVQARADDARAERGRVLAELTALTAPDSRRWAETLAAIDLTGGTALDELGELRGAVQRYQRIFLPPGASPLDPGKRSIEPVLMRLQWEQEERDARRRATAAEFDPVLAGLASLIDAVERYRSARG